MFPKFDEVPIRTYLIVLAKMRRPSTIPVGEDLEVLVEQHDVGGVLGHVGRGLHRDPDVRVVQGDSVVDAVAEEPDRRAQRALGLDDPRLLLRGDAREDRRLRQRGGELRVVELLELGAGERSVDGQADVGADLLRDAVVVAGDDLHLDVEALEAVERVAGVGLRTIDEGEEAREVQVVLVVGAQGRAGRRPRASRRRSRGCRRRTGASSTRLRIAGGRLCSGRGPSRARP